MRKIIIFSAFFVVKLLAIQNHPTELVIDRILKTPVHYPVRFAFVADSRNSFDPGDPSGDSIFSLIKETINEISPVFVIHGGDFVQRGYTWEYSHFVHVIDSFETNLLTVLGNHELYADEGPTLYDSIFGPTDYYFDYGGYRFIVMADCQQDSLIDPYYGTHRIDYLFTEEQIAWLDSILKEADSLGHPSFVFAHVPPYLPGHDTTHCLGYYYYFPRPNYPLSHTEEFTNLLRTHGVAAGIFGHQHFYDRWIYQGVLYLISGGGGAPLVYPLQPPPYGAYTYHFLLFELDSTHEITVKFYRAGEFLPDPQFTFTYSADIAEEASPRFTSGSNSQAIVLRQGEPLPLSSRFKVDFTGLYDISGRKLLDILESSTHFSVDFTPGIYFLVYRAQGFKRTQKVVLLPR